MRPAALLLILGVSLYSAFQLPRNFGKTVLDFASEKRGNLLCQASVGDPGVSRWGYSFVASHIKCLDKDKMKALSGRLKVRVKNIYWFDTPDLKTGDLIRFKAFVVPLKRYSNFDENKYSFNGISGGILASGYVSSPGWIIKIADSKNIFLSVIEKWKEMIGRALKASCSDSSGGDLLRALLLGDQGSIDRQSITDMKILGVIHLIVVSGLNVAVVALICWGLIKFIFCLCAPIFGQVDSRRTCAIASIIMVWVFAGLTAFNIPVVRASITATIFLLSFLMYGKTDSRDALSLAVIIILLMNPLAIYSISFQLTFAAVVGIFTVSKFTLFSDEKSSMKKKAAVGLGNAIIISLGASAGVFPLLSYHFGKLPLLSPLFSTLLAPIITVILVPGALFGGLLVPIFPLFAKYIFRILVLPSELFLNVSGWLADNFSWSQVELKLPLSVIFGLYGLIIMTIYWRNIRFKAVAIVAIAGIFLTGLFMTQPLESFDGKLSVTFIDVGQGAAVVVRLPDGKTILVDGGGIKGAEEDLGKLVLEPFLKKLGVEIVNTVIVTHPHPDHFKGLAYIIENFRPEKCLVGSYSGDGLDDTDLAEWNTFLGRVERAGVPIEKIVPKNWNESGVEFSFFSPPDAVPNGWTVNDTSAVLRIGYDEVSFLLTGDAESQLEEYLLQSGAELGSTVLQVPHHGSSSSSGPSFLDEVSPQYGVIQVGAMNRYGFPNVDVLERLNERSIKVYRTDQDGAVSFVTDGEQLKIFSSNNN